ncbi:DUF6691 family protein [Reinekea sp.]|uniref:DUF6691 family protein n=1 Tax=Reinekea sp. TaxID=1970455 RepID=UPI00257C6D56|nr:DUF6691 family protein [Reinekea sp.]
MLGIQRLVFALLAGVIFGLGLSIAQMIDPAKVINFLNPLGPWDPSLMVVLAVGLAINALATPLILKRERPLFDNLFRVPAKSQIDAKIIGGGVLFGIGWGIAGYCPGPLLTSLSFANSDILISLAAYVVGTLVTKWVIARIEAARHIEHAAEEACVG